MYRFMVSRTRHNIKAGVTSVTELKFANSCSLLIVHFRSIRFHGRIKKNQLTEWKLYCRTFKFHKVMQQQFRGSVVCLIPTSAAVQLWIRQWEKLPKFAYICQSRRNKSGTVFFKHTMWILTAVYGESVCSRSSMTGARNAGLEMTAILLRPQCSAHCATVSGRCRLRLYKGGSISQSGWSMPSTPNPLIVSRDCRAAAAATAKSGQCARIVNTASSETQGVDGAHTGYAGVSYQV